MNEPKPKENADQSANDWGSRKHIHTLMLMVITVAGIYLCYLMAAPFLSALTWALALAVMFTPLYRWLVRKIMYPNLAATICILAATLTVIVPAIFVAERVIDKATRSAEAVNLVVESGEWRHLLENHQILAPILHWIERYFDLPEILNSATSWLTSSASSFVQGSVLQLLGIVLAFYIFFYFLRDRSTALASLRSLSPLSEADMNRVIEGVNDTVHATIYGTIAVSIVQGALGGLMFWWLGLPSPILWGIVMALLAVVPVLGAFIIWVPAAIFLFVDGSEGKALLLTLWGTIVVGGIDNLLYPMLVGNRLKIHTILAFISIVGGLIVFGPSGLILGPVTFTITKILLEIWGNQNSIEQAKDQAD